MCLAGTVRVTLDVFPWKWNQSNDQDLQAEDALIVVHIGPIFKLATPCSSITRIGSDTRGKTGRATGPSTMYVVGMMY